MIVATVILLIFGIIQMAVASLLANKLQKKTKNINFERKWLLIQSLIIIFLLSYIGMLAYILLYQFHDLLLWIAIVYCFGASFALLMLLFAKQSLSALRSKQESFLHILFETLGHPLYVIDSSSSKIVLANHASTKNIGSSDNEKFFDIHNHGKLMDEEGRDLLSIIKESGKAFTTNYIVHDDQNGTEKNYEVSAYPVISKQNKLDKVIVSIMDISSSIEIEKMNAVNAMIITYNHQINNPLTIAIGSLEIGIEELEGGENNQALKDVKNALYRIAEIVRKISEIESSHGIKYEKYCDNKMVKF